MPDPQQKLVQVNGIGVISFPPEMPDDEVKDFIRTQLKHPNTREKAQQTHKSTKNEFPMETETSEHRRQNPNEPPQVPWPGLPHLGATIVDRPESWADKNIPYTTGIAQTLAKQLVGISKLAKGLDQALDIDKPLPLRLMVGKRVISLPNTLEELPGMKKFDESSNKKIEEFAEEGPSNKEEVRGQLIADLAELDLGEEGMEQIGKFIAASGVLSSSESLRKFLDYFDKYKAFAHGKAISKRTSINAFIAGVQALATEGDVDKAVEEARKSIKTQAVFEAAGFGLSTVLPEAEEAGGESSSESGEPIPKSPILAGVAKEARAEGKVESTDEYATVGMTADPAETIATPEEAPSPVDRAVKAGKKTKEVSSHMTMDEKKKQEELSARDKFLLDSLRFWRIRLQNATAEIE